MRESFEIEAVSRDVQGKGASRRLRREGMVPGILYGGGKSPQMFATNHDDLIHHLDNEAFYSHILELKMDGNSQQVVLKDLQRHPAKPFVSHVDLLRVVMDEEIRMTVPLHFEGEEDCPGIKAGGTALHAISDLEIECLPKDLPEYIAIDMSEMDMDDVIHLSEVVLPAGVGLVGADQITEDNDPIVASVGIVRTAEEVEEVSEEEGEELPPEEGAEPDSDED